MQIPSLSKLVGLFVLFAGSLFADQSSTNVIPIPGAQNQFTGPTPVQAIVVDKNGNLTEQTYTYDPSQGGVIIVNNNQVGGDDASIFFPLFSMGFMWWSGYWVGHDGRYWDGHNYVRVNNYNHWNNHWHNYWNNWNNHNWNNHWNRNRNNPKWQYRDNQRWRDQSGRQWRSRNGGARAGGGRR